MIGTDYMFNCDEYEMLSLLISMKMDDIKCI